MRYINGEEVKIGDIVCYISSSKKDTIRPCLTGGTIVAIGTETVIINDCGKTVVMYTDQIYPM